MRITLSLLTCALVGIASLALSSDQGRAQDPQADTTGQVGGTMVATRPDSATEVEEYSSDNVAARTFETPSVLLPVDHLLGEWGGLRPRLEDRGITPTITWVTNMAGNPVGGLNRSFTECDNLGMDFRGDLEKIYGMPNAQFHVSASQRSGRSLSNAYIGNAFNVQQVYGGETFKVIDVEYIQRFYDGRLSFHMGRIAAGDDFFSSPYYWLFMQNGIDGNPVGIFKNAPGMSAYPNATWGGRMRIRPTPRTYVLAGVYNGDPSIRDNDSHGMDWSMHGPLFAITEFCFQRNGQPGDEGKLGNYKVGAYYNAGSFTDSVGRVLGSSASLFNLTARTTEDNWGYYFLVDQVVWDYGAPEQKRGIGLFASFIVAPDERINEMPFFCNGGVAWRGPFACRPTDVAGFAIVYGEFSDDLRRAQRLAQTLDPSAGVQSHELVFEWCYRFRLRDGAVYFQPDLQYIVNPGGTGQIDNALVVGCQLGVNF